MTISPKEFSYPKSAPLDYAGNTKQEEYFFVAPPAPASSNLIALPGENHEQALEFLRAVEYQYEDTKLSSYHGANLVGIHSVAWMTDRLAAVRRQYLKDLINIRRMYRANNHDIDEHIARLLVEMRTAVREKAREASDLHHKIYELRDLAVTKYKKLRGKPTPEELIQAGEYEKVSKSAGRYDTRYGVQWARAPKGIVKHFRKVGGIGTIILAIEVSAEAAAVYSAKNEAEEAKALDRLTDTGIEAAGQIAGTIAMASICVALGVATGGIAFLACGVAGGVGGGLVAGPAVDKIMEMLD